MGWEATTGPMQTCVREIRNTPCAHHGTPGSRRRPRTPRACFCPWNPWDGRAPKFVQLQEAPEQLARVDQETSRPAVCSGPHTAAACKRATPRAPTRQNVMQPLGSSMHPRGSSGIPGHTLDHERTNNLKVKSFPLFSPRGCPELRHAPAAL